jgi:glyoxylase-like metal-dependent hydrolase (beta-lactamase superfamily II)
VHDAEADALANPNGEVTLSTRYATDDMFIAQPAGWRASDYHVMPAPAQTLLRDGDLIDLGDRVFQIIHTPGHSPGGIGLYEKETGIFLSGDIIYDGPLIDDTFHSHVPTYVSTLDRLRSLHVSTVHGGHFPSFGQARFRQLIDEYMKGKHMGGCHLGGAIK